MKLKNSVKEEIIKTLTDIGRYGATIVEISNKIGLERHTVSKYMKIMKGDGIVACKSIGKAKLWFVNKNTLENLAKRKAENMSAAERTLSQILAKSPVGMIVMDKNFRIQFMNDLMTNRYGEVTGQYFYRSILGLPNPLKLSELIEIIDNKKICSSELCISDKLGETMLIRAAKIESTEMGTSIILATEFKGRQDQKV